MNLAASLRLTVAQLHVDDGGIGLLGAWLIQQRNSKLIIYSIWPGNLCSAACCQCFAPDFICGVKDHPAGKLPPSALKRVQNLPQCTPNLDEVINTSSCRDELGNERLEGRRKLDLFWLELGDQRQ